MKIQNYTKSIKIKSQHLSGGGAEVLGRFSRTYHTSTSVAQWWKHCCIWGLCLIRKVVPLLAWAAVRWICTWLGYLVPSRRESWQASADISSISHKSRLLDQTNTHKPWVSCSSALSHWHLFLCQIIEEKEKSEASIIRLFFSLLNVSFSHIHVQVFFVIF